jgi:hypothetical protein
VAFSVAGPRANYRTGNDPISQTHPVKPDIRDASVDDTAIAEGSQRKLRNQTALKAVQAPVPADQARQRYVLSCAAITAASQLLIAAHSAVGAPSDDIATSDVALRNAVAQARTAAGAMSVVAGRLLTRVREDEARALPNLPPPARANSGVTSPSRPAEADARMTSRAIASGAAECVAALGALESCDADQNLRRLMADLVRISELMSADLTD